MIEYLNVFINNLLPVFLIAGIGFLLAKFRPIDPRTLSNLIFYIFSPCLVFYLLTHATLSDGDLIKTLLFVSVCVTAIGIITWIFGKGLRFDRQMLAAILISVMFMNAGNYGLSVISFAFGDNALAYASLIFVASSILASTFGVVIASSGKKNILQALSNLYKIPTVYAVILAFIFMRTNISLPLPLERTTELLGNASIPAMLILLGIQFHSIELKGIFLPLAFASGMRLIVSPLVAFAISSLFGLSGAAQQAGVAELAMPSAVINLVLATQFDAQPKFVSAVVSFTTLLSAVTLTPILAFLGA